MPMSQIVIVVPLLAILALATSIDPEAGALVRIAPARLVWWKGWSSGSLAGA